MIATSSPWTVQAVAEATGGAVSGDTEAVFVGVSTDTRDALGTRLFVALSGPSFDGHDFLERAVEGGARGLLVDLRRVDAARRASLSSRATLIDVPDPLRALGDLAAAHRRAFAGPVLALTGSNGKTTTKELVGALLGTTGPTLRTAGNLNNLIGLPMTVLGLSPDHVQAVLELGMNARGEIARMTEIADPDVGLVINVGPAHIGMLGSLEAIGLAKGELYEGLRPDAVRVVNVDDALVRAAFERAPGPRRGFGTSTGAEVRVLDATPSAAGQTITLSVDGRPLSIELGLPGRHNALNLAAAVAAATALRPDLDLEAAARAVAALGSVGRRLERRACGRLSVIDDSYNANAASMVAAIDTCAELARRSGARLVVLLGEMRELGDFSEAEHRRVGAAAVSHGASVVAAFGEGAAPIAAEALQAGLTARHETTDEEALFAWLSEHLAVGDLVLLKGSRGIRMERFLPRLEAWGA
jgi:UDP-N-acetylmuramoyl-tripeptide--D-alanyl-D-alanine ligase